MLNWSNPSANELKSNAGTERSAILSIMWIMGAEWDESLDT